MSAQDEDPPGARRVSTHTADPAEPARLVDDPAVRADVSAAWALGLLRGAEPYRAPAGRKQRVQLRLGHTPRRHAPLVLRLAVMALVLCGCAAIVSAALGHWPDWMARAYERVVGAPPPGRRPRRPARARAAPRSAARANRTPVADEAPSERGAAQRNRRPRRQRDPAPAPAAPVARAPEPRAAARHDRAAACAPRGRTRRAVDRARTRRRCRRRCARSAWSATRCARAACSRATSPSTRTATLAEEALAMSIEAAIAHHDADVAALASRYLRLYPHGSFQALARQALRRRQSP